MMADFDAGLVWFRRDLRVADHAALYHALTAAAGSCARSFSTATSSRRCRKTTGAWSSSTRASSNSIAALRDAGGRLIVRHGVPLQRDSRAGPRMRRAGGVRQSRLRAVGEGARRCGRGKSWRARASRSSRSRTSRFRSRRGADRRRQAVHRLHAVQTQLARDADAGCAEAVCIGGSSRRAGDAAVARASTRFPRSTHSASRRARARAVPPARAARCELFDDFRDRMTDYHRTRDFPAVKGPSYLGVHLRYGTISIRALARTRPRRASATATTAPKRGCRS